MQTLWRPQSETRSHGLSVCAESRPARVPLETPLRTHGRAKAQATRAVELEEKLRPVYARTRSRDGGEENIRSRARKRRPRLRKIRGECAETGEPRQRGRG